MPFNVGDLVFDLKRAWGDAQRFGVDTFVFEVKAVHADGRLCLRNVNLRDDPNYYWNNESPACYMLRSGVDSTGAPLDASPQVMAELVRARQAESSWALSVVIENQLGALPRATTRHERMVRREARAYIEELRADTFHSLLAQYSAQYVS